MLNTSVERCDTPRSRQVTFEAFWAGSRYRSSVPGVDLGAHVKRAFDEMVAEGGFVRFIERVDGGQVAGSMAVFHDPWYRSREQDDVACFGLVSALDAGVLADMIDEARVIARQHGAFALRGPVNPPRSLLGYGIQVSGFGLPLLAGTSCNTEAEAVPFMELDVDGYFDKTDVYYNLLQDFDKTRAFTTKIPFDRSFTVVNPDLDHLGDLPARVAGLMNETLGYRPDYQATSAERLATAARQYKAMPGGERLMGFFFDGDVLAGGVIMQPDWFQVLRGEPVTTVIGDIYMLAKAYQGKNVLYNCSEYSETALTALGTTFYEHASIWEGTPAIMYTVKKGLNRIAREFRVHEVRL
jgi:hypothetical protein